jgi:hypothetical protein
VASAWDFKVKLTERGALMHLLAESAVWDTRSEFVDSHERNIGTGEEFTGISAMKRLTCPQCFPRSYNELGGGY